MGPVLILCFTLVDGARADPVYGARADPPSTEPVQTPVHECYYPVHGPRA